MSDTVNSLSQLNILFQSMILSMLGYVKSGSPTSYSKEAFSAVRVSWPTGGAPAWKITDDVIFIQTTEQDAEINRQRDILNTMVGSPEELNQAMSYNRVVKLGLVLYGPNSWDHAQEIRDQIFYQVFHDYLAEKSLYLVTDISAPVRMPEVLPETGQWWERVDFKMLFNEQIVRNLQVPYVLSDEVIVETEDAIVIADINVNIGG